MSASIHTLLADELGISDAKAKKLLSAMLREVHKRARTGGVRLPNLGKFKEKDGQLTFIPEDSLVRAVNHRFEGLASEDLGTAPMEEEEDESPEEPSTITLGYQDSSNWSPLDSEDDASSDDSEETSEAPDTAEFQVPDAEATGAEAPDAPSDAEAPPSSSSSTEAPDAPDSSPDTESSSDPDPARSGPKETEQLYPLVEDVPGSAESEDEPDGSDASAGGARPADSDEPAPDDEPAAPKSSDATDEASSESSDDFFGAPDDDDHDTLSGIWDSVDEEVEGPEPPSPEEGPRADDPEGPASRPAADDEPDGTMPDLSEIGPSGDEAAPPAEAADASPEAPSATAPGATEPDDASEPTPAPAGGDSEADSGSSIPRIIVSILVFLMLGGGAWYILGQRGMVQSPAATIAQLRGNLQSGTSGSNNSTSSVPEFSPEASSEESSEESSPSDVPDPDNATASAEASADGAAPATDSDPTSAEPSSDDPTPPEESPSDPGSATGDTPSSPPQLDPAAGGWSIIVASRTDRDGAQALVDRYRDRFDQALPMGLIEATVDNTTRYRVGVGQFSSRSDAQAFLSEHSDSLPDGAWPVSL